MGRRVKFRRPRPKQQAYLQVHLGKPLGVLRSEEEYDRQCCRGTKAQVHTVTRLKALSGLLGSWGT